jgi:hypothetical protein
MKKAWGLIHWDLLDFENLYMGVFGESAWKQAGTDSSFKYMYTLTGDKFGNLRSPVCTWESNIHIGLQYKFERNLNHEHTNMGGSSYTRWDNVITCLIKHTCFAVCLEDIEWGRSLGVSIQGIIIKITLFRYGNIYFLGCLWESSFWLLPEGFQPVATGCKR